MPCILLFLTFPGRPHSIQDTVDFNHSEHNVGTFVSCWWNDWSEPGNKVFSLWSMDAKWEGWFETKQLQPYNYEFRLPLIILLGFMPDHKHENI